MKYISILFLFAAVALAAQAPFSIQYGDRALNCGTNSCKLACVEGSSTCTSNREVNVNYVVPFPNSGDQTLFGPLSDFGNTFGEFIKGILDVIQKVFTLLGNQGGLPSSNSSSPLSGLLG